MNPDDRLELRTVALALLASLLLWNLPFGGLVLYPFKLFATWLHELSHGIAMVATGAGLDCVVIYRDTSGLAYPRTLVTPTGTAVIAGAGYMGTALWGAVLLVVTPTGRAARVALLVLAALLGVSAVTVIAIDGEDAFGPWSVGVMAVVVAALALVLPDRWRRAVAHFVAAQACVNALLDIRVLLRPAQVVGGQLTGRSDAHSMALATFGTAAPWAVWTWAAVWLGWSLIVLYVALRFSGSPALASVVPAGRATASPPGGSDHGAHRRSPDSAPGGTAPSGPAGTAGS